MRYFQRLACFLASVAFILLHAIPSEAESSSAAVNITIAAQPLDKALDSWAKQTGYQILWSDEKGLGDLMAPKIDGALTPEAALRQLLARTGLTYQFVDDKSVAIQAAAK